MKLLVLGATGGIGIELVTQAIEKRHEVTAFVRNPDALEAFGNKVTAVKGDLLSSWDLRNVIQGHDAILSGFGPRVPIVKCEHDLLTRFAAALTDAVKHTTLRRVLVVSVAFLFKDALIPPAYLLGKLFFPNIVRDAANMEERIANSELDWTLVRPPQLTDAPLTGNYRIREGHLPALGFKISRADVADYMFKALDDNATVGKIVGVSN
jgi:putative NADH-flavin reductase